MVHSSKRVLSFVLLVASLIAAGCTSLAPKTPTPDIEATVGAQVAATVQAGQQTALPDQGQAEPTAAPLAITVPQAGICTLDGAMDVSGVGEPGSVVVLQQIMLPNAEGKGRLELARVSVDDGGGWRVADVPLACGPNTLVAENETTGQQSDSVRIIRSQVPPGPYLSSDPADFGAVQSKTSRDKLVAAYYYYWYDATAPETGHMAERIHHEPDESADQFTWKNVDWHKRHLEDMIAARIDIVLPVYWGVPCEAGDGRINDSSTAGLEKLVAAQEQLLAEGAQPPKIGMLYDTSSLGVETTYIDSYAPRGDDGKPRADLTDRIGMERFYLPIRDFYSLVPPKLWAAIDGRPIVWLYTDAYVGDYDAETFAYVRRQFAKDFGGLDPYLVRESSWDEARLQASGLWVTDNAYTWGASIVGYQRTHSIASIGPGYDESAIPERHNCASQDAAAFGCPKVRDREEGAWYASAWQAALREESVVNIVAIETWNEYHVGSGIAETQEFGRQYIDLTAAYACRFKWQADCPPLPATGGAASAQERILFISDRDGNAEIYVINSSGSGLINLSNNPGWDSDPVWSPDGTRIAFVSDRDGNVDIYVVRADGSGLANLTRSPAGESYPAWSPDGTRIAFVSAIVSDNAVRSRDVYVINADGSDLIQLRVGTDTEPWLCSEPAWSPDGRLIAVECDKLLSKYTRQYQIYLFQVDGSGAVNLTANDLQGFEPLWSPDGSHLLFCTGHGRDSSLYVADIHDLTRIEVETDYAGSGAWSPDGSSIAYTSWSAGLDETMVNFVNADGSGRVTLSRSFSEALFPDWSPDGSSVLFVAVDNSDWEVLVVDADGSGLRNLTNDPSDDDSASWSPDGTRIVFMSNRDGNEEMYVMNADGTGLVNLTNHPASDHPAWDIRQVWSP